MVRLVGRIVHYQLTSYDVNEIRIKADVTSPFKANPHSAGQIVPATIVKVWGPEEAPSANLAVQIDGNFTLWRTSVAHEGNKIDGGEQFGHYSWVEDAQDPLETNADEVDAEVAIPDPAVTIAAPEEVAESPEGDTDTEATTTPDESVSTGAPEAPIDAPATPSDGFVTEGGPGALAT